MKLEIGKEYVTRSGLKVKIYDISENENYPIFAGTLEKNNIVPRTYTKKGRFHVDSQSDYDIVGEWQEPLEFDWSCLPAWANKYIAMDEDGRWFAFSEIPTRPNPKVYGWRRPGGAEAALIPKDYAPKNFKGTWKDSLFKNPNKCEK